MKTDDLVDLLATNAHAVDVPYQRHRLLRSGMLGLFLAFVLVVFGLGIQPDLAGALARPMFWVKVTLGGVLAWISFLCMRGLACPGGNGRFFLFFLPIPVIMVWGMAGWAVAMAPSGDARALFWGQTWLVCPFLIWMLSLPVFVCVLYALKDMAPTQPVLTGAVAGLFAGAVAVFVYSMHCPELQAPFVGVWYVFGMLLATGTGAVAGGRFLYW